MPQINQRGAIQFVVLLILLAGIVGGVYLVLEGPKIFKPKAGPGTTVEFVDTNGNRILTTSTPQILIKLSSPDWSQQSGLLFTKDAYAQSNDSCGLPQRSPNGSICLGERCGSDGDCRTGYCCTGTQCGSSRYKCTNRDGSIPAATTLPSTPTPTVAPIAVPTQSPAPVPSQTPTAAPNLPIDSCGMPQRSPNGSICLGQRCSSDEDCRTGYCCKGKSCGDNRYKCTNRDGSINPPTPLVFTPTPTPTPTTASVVLAEDPNFTVNKLETPFTTNPISFTFSDASLGGKTLFVKFIASDGSTKNANPFPAIIELVTPTATPTSKPTESPATIINPDQLIGLIEDIRGAPGYRYDAKDNQGNCMDTVKIIESGISEYKYLAVYHCLSGSTFNVYLAGSDDLLNWAYITSLDSRASQPTIERLFNGGYLVILEASDSGNHLRFRYYQDYPSLASGTYQKIFDAPRSLSPNCSEGTPNVYSVKMTSDINSSAIDVGFHFHQYSNGRCTVDRQARGRLNGFTSWSAQVETSLNQMLVAQGVSGNIGDRDSFPYQKDRFVLVEGQLREKDYSSWRSYIHPYSNNTIKQLALNSHNGSTAFANPTLTLLTLPNGQPGFVATFYIFSEGAASGEAGPLIYYKPLP